MNCYQSLKGAWIAHEAAFKAAREARRQAIKEAWEAYDEAAAIATKAFEKVLNSNQPGRP